MCCHQKIFLSICLADYTCMTCAIKWMSDLWFAQALKTIKNRDILDLGYMTLVVKQEYSDDFW